jgi:hypothetical protein
MAVAHRPLFGLTCAGEPVPAATDLDCAMALEDAFALRSALERAPDPVSASDRTMDNRPPAPEPDFVNAPTFTPGRR